MRELVSTYRGDRNMIAAFLGRAARDPFLREEGVRFRRLVSARITDLLMTRRAEFAHPEPEVAIDLGVQLAFGLMLQHVIFAETRAAGRVLEDDEIESELTRNFIGYLGIDTPTVLDD
jgi:hypothetical protein